MDACLRRPGAGCTGTRARGGLTGSSSSPGSGAPLRCAQLHWTCQWATCATAALRTADGGLTSTMVNGTVMAAAAPPQRDTQPQPPHAVAASTAAIQTTYVEVSFRVNFHAEFGTAVHVSGDAPALGGWSPLAAPRMQWEAGDDWVLTTLLPAGSHHPSVINYKYVILDPTGRPVRWQEGPNLSLSLTGAAPGARLDATDSWCQAIQMRAYYPGSAWPPGYSAWAKGASMAAAAAGPRPVAAFMQAHAPQQPPPPPSAWPHGSSSGSGSSTAAAAHARAALQHDLAEALAALPSSGGSNSSNNAPGAASAALQTAAMQEGLRQLQSLGRGRSSGVSTSVAPAATARDVERLRAAFSPLASSLEEDDEDEGSGSDEIRQDGGAEDEGPEGALAAAGGGPFGAAAFLGLRSPAAAARFDDQSAAANGSGFVGVEFAAGITGCSHIPDQENPLADPLVAALLSSDPDDCEECCAFLHDAISSCSSSMDSMCSVDGSASGSTESVCSENAGGAEGQKHGGSSESLGDWSASDGARCR